MLRAFTLTGIHPTKWAPRAQRARPAGQDPSSHPTCIPFTPHRKISPDSTCGGTRPMSHRKLLALTLLLTAIPSLAVAPGSPAPDFKGTDSNGVQHSLSQYKGKFVVLEWANKGCPIRPEALPQRQHGEPPERMDRQRRHLALRHLLSPR